jgi:demethoxyubiquinone hydroxylase (CLK1/Coq7/Cat5 family)
MKKVEIEAFDVVDVSLMLITMKTALGHVKAIEKNYAKKVDKQIKSLQKAYKSQLSSEESGIVAERIMKHYKVDISK